MNDDTAPTPLPVPQNLSYGSYIELTCYITWFKDLQIVDSCMGRVRIGNGRIKMTSEEGLVVGDYSVNDIASVTTVDIEGVEIDLAIAPNHSFIFGGTDLPGYDPIPLYTELQKYAGKTGAVFAASAESKWRTRRNIFIACLIILFLLIGLPLMLYKGKDKTNEQKDSDAQKNYVTLKQFGPIGDMQAERFVKAIKQDNFEVAKTYVCDGFLEQTPEDKLKELATITYAVSNSEVRGEPISNYVLRTQSDTSLYKTAGGFHYINSKYWSKSEGNIDYLEVYSKVNDTSQCVFRVVTADNEYMNVSSISYGNSLESIQ